MLATIQPKKNASFLDCTRRDVNKCLGCGASGCFVVCEAYDVCTQCGLRAEQVFDDSAFAAGGVVSESYQNRTHWSKKRQLQEHLTDITFCDETSTHATAHKKGLDLIENIIETLDSRGLLVNSGKIETTSFDAWTQFIVCQAQSPDHKKYTGVQEEAAAILCSAMMASGQVAPFAVVAQCVYMELSDRVSEEHHVRKRITDRASQLFRNQLLVMRGKRPVRRVKRKRKRQPETKPSGAPDKEECKVHQSPVEEAAVRVATTLASVYKPTIEPQHDKHMLTISHQCRDTVHSILRQKGVSKSSYSGDAAAVTDIVLGSLLKQYSEAMQRCTDTQVKRYIMDRSFVSAGLLVRCAFRRYATGIDTSKERMLIRKRQKFSEKRGVRCTDDTPISRYSVSRDDLRRCDPRITTSLVNQVMKKLGNMGLDLKCQS